MTATSRIRNKVDAIADRALKIFTLLVMGFIITYMVAPTRANRIAMWLFLTMPLITMIVLMVLRVI